MTACSAPPVYWSTGSHFARQLAAERPLVVVRVDVAHLVPRRAHERVHRVGLAPRRLAADRAGRVQEALVIRQRRFAGRAELGVFRQQHRQVLLGHRHDAVGLAVDDRDRRAPVALARDQPVAQAVGDGAAAEAAAPRRTSRPRAIASASGVPSKGPELIIVPPWPSAAVSGAAVPVGMLEDGHDLQAVLRRELEVALVVRRARP